MNILSYSLRDCLSAMPGLRPVVKSDTVAIFAVLPRYPRY